MAYKPNIPQANDFQDVSQGDILANFQQLDTTLAIDHYPPSDLNPTNGKHKHITAVPQTSHPSTAASETKIYSYKEDPSTTNLGPIVYVRGESDAVQTPLTKLQGNDAYLANETKNIFDFSGIVRALFRFMIFSANNSYLIDSRISYVSTASPKFNISQFQNPVGSGFLIGQSSDILTLKNRNSAETLYWTIDFYRIQ